LSQDPRGSLWLSSPTNGIANYVDGRFRTFDQSDGLPSDAVQSIDASDASYLWLRTESGLVRITKESLGESPQAGKSELKMSQFDEKDGLPSNAMGTSGNQCALRFADGASGSQRTVELHWSRRIFSNGRRHTRIP